MDVFFVTLSAMMVLFLCIAIGFILNKTKVLPENSGTVMSKLENYVFVPALVFSTFSANCTIDSLKNNSNIVLYSLLALAIAFSISIPLSFLFVKKDYYQRNIYRYALTFGNFGFMGNAIVPAILSVTFGDKVLYFYLLFTLPLQVAVNTWGIYAMIPKDNKINPLKNLINPIFISIILGIICGILDANKYFPEFFKTTLQYLSNCMAPVSMVLTGFIIGGYSFKELLNDKKVYITTFLRLFLIPAIIILILVLANASDLIVCLATFAYATPLGINTVVFPAAYGGDTKTGASMAMISHTLSVISIPIMFTLITKLI